MKCPYCGADATKPLCDYCGSDLNFLFQHERQQSASYQTKGGFSNVQGSDNNITQNVINNYYYGSGPVRNNFGQPYGYPMSSPKSKIAAIILCCIGFFGLGGLHRLYAGHFLSGLLWFFTYGLFGIGTLVDLVRLASNSFKDGQGMIINN